MGVFPNNISTHAPRAGSDNHGSDGIMLVELFQPTLPVRGATLLTLLRILTFRLFQPTLPVRGATIQPPETPILLLYFNPRSPCGERRLFPRKRLGENRHFNPRSPCGERHDRRGGISWAFVFQPTLPVRGATYERRCRAATVRISTHAPRAGSDQWDCQKFVEQMLFQPTLPVRGATQLHRRQNGREHISTHAPRAGSDKPPKL